jgi:hypothetical protein
MVIGTEENKSYDTLTPAWMASTSAKWECIFHDIILSIFLEVIKKDMWVSLRGGQCQPRPPTFEVLTTTTQHLVQKAAEMHWHTKKTRKRRKRERKREFIVP